ncbi:MAG: recombinase RecA [Trueperaceae bacterium]|nr:recombinase RecA [Trueperaceae bacterium]
MRQTVNDAPRQSDEKREVLNRTLSQIERTYGKGAVMRLGDEASRERVGVISTGSMSVDLALGVGGVPRGRVVEVYGPEAGGKTTLALHVIAEAQALGGVAAFVDAEHALDPSYAEALGVDVEELLVSQPDTGEQALEIMELLVRSGAVDVVVVDSVAALVPRAEIEGEMGDSHVGLQARLMSQALRKLTSVVSKSGTTALFINQVREKIGVMYGNPETTPGGRALKFYTSVRIEVRRKGDVKVGADKVGNRVRVKVTKNKVAPPFREAEIDIVFGQGIDKTGDLIQVASDLGVIQKSGSWFSYGDTRLGQGKEKVGDYLREHPEVARELRERVTATLHPPKTPQGTPDGVTQAGGATGDAHLAGEDAEAEIEAVA